MNYSCKEKWCPIPRIQRWLFFLLRHTRAIYFTVRYISECKTLHVSTLAYLRNSIWLVELVNIYLEQFTRKLHAVHFSIDTWYLLHSRYHYNGHLAKLGTLSNIPPFLACCLKPVYKDSYQPQHYTSNKCHSNSREKNQWECKLKTRASNDLPDPIPF